MLTWFEQYATYVSWHFSACFSKTSAKPGNIESSLHTASSSAKNVCDADNTLGTPPNSFFLSIGVRISFINVLLLRNSFSRTRREFKYDASEVKISNFASWIFLSSGVRFSICWISFIKSCHIRKIVYSDIMFVTYVKDHYSLLVEYDTRAFFVPIWKDLSRLPSTSYLPPANTKLCAQ